MKKNITVDYHITNTEYPIYRVSEWDKYQQYKKTAPRYVRQMPWFKFHARELLQQRRFVMLDAEKEKIKVFLENKTGGQKYNLIPIKDDLSHLILMHRALKRNEFIAIHADRVSEVGKNIELKFLKSKTEFPLGPFILAHKFKAPITFVYAAKASKFHYELYATDPLTVTNSPEEVAQKYVTHLESMVYKYPTQWFNFYNYYAS